MGGENICVTRGVVSRIDLMDYTFSPIGQSGSSVLGAWSVEVLQFQVSYRGARMCPRRRLNTAFEAWARVNWQRLPFPKPETWDMPWALNSWGSGWKPHARPRMRSALVRFVHVSNRERELRY